MQKTLEQPGVHVWKSKVSGQYFTAIKVEGNEESVLRCIRFVKPDMLQSDVQKILSQPNLIDGNFIHFNIPGGTEHKIKIGSYLCKNMFGTLISLDADHFESIMQPVNDEDKEQALTNYFFVSCTVGFGTTTSITSFVYKTYEAYPSPQSIKEMVTKIFKERHNIELGPEHSVVPTNIQKLTELEYLSYLR